jgi:hypothetical protein
MAHDYFDLHEPEGMIDDREGVDVDCPEDVRARAVEAARDLMCAQLRVGALRLDSTIQVRNELDRVVLTLPFHEVVTIQGS